MYRKKTLLFQIISFLMCILFVYSCIVQYNDEDAFLWIGIYAISLFFSILSVVGKFSIFSLFFSVVYLIYAVFLFVSLAPKEIHIDNEVLRECGGLIVSSIWLFIISFPIIRTKER